MDAGSAAAKYSTDSLSKVWKPLTSLTPFYSGGKISSANDGKSLYCLHNSQINTFSITDQLEIKQGLILENEEIICFCLSLNGKFLATFSRNLLLRHWDCISWTCVTTIKGHKMPVLSMCYDETCTLVATGSSDSVVRVWDITQGFCTHSFKYHHDIIREVRFLSNSKSNSNSSKLYLFSSSDDCTLKCFNLLNSKCVGDFSNHLSAPTDLAFTDDNEFMISVGRDKVMNFYRLSTMTIIKSQALLEELEAIIILPCHSTSSDSQNRKRKANSERLSYIIITAGERGILTIFQWDYEIQNDFFSCVPLCIFNIDTGSTSDYHHSSQSQASCGVTNLQYFHDSQTLMLTTTDHRILLFSMTTTIPISILPRSQYVGSFDDILGISLVPDPVFSSNKLNADSLTELLSPNKHLLSPMVGSMRMAVVSNSPVVHLLDRASSTTPLVGHSDIVLSVQSSPDGKWVVTSSKDCSCRVWCTSTSKCIGIASGHTDAVSSIALSQRLNTYATNCAIFASGGGDKVLKRWRFPVEQNLNFNEPIELSATHSVRAHDKDINTIAISPNDALIASGSHDTHIRLWSSQDLSAIVTLVGHRKSIWCVKFSPVDKCLASSSGDRTLKLWSLVDYTCLRTLQGHTASVLCLQFVRHGMQIISAAADGLLYLWTIRTGERENILDKHTEKVWGLEKIQFHDTEVLLSCGSDSQIISWYDATPEEELIRLEAHEKNTLMEQQLGNCIKSKRYVEALNLAFELKYPNKILQILQLITTSGDHLTSSDSSAGENCLNHYTKNWSMNQIIQILDYLKEWNTNSRHSKVVHLLFQSLIEVFGVTNFLNLPYLSDLLLSLSSYSERHFQRVDRLHESIYLLEYLDSESSLSHGNVIE